MTSSASSAIVCSGTARLLSLVLPVVGAPRQTAWLTAGLNGVAPLVAAFLPGRSRGQGRGWARPVSGRTTLTPVSTGAQSRSRVPRFDEVFSPPESPPRGDEGGSPCARGAQSYLGARTRMVRRRDDRWGECPHGGLLAAARSLEAVQAVPGGRPVSGAGRRASVNWWAEAARGSLSGQAAAAVASSCCASGLKGASASSPSSRRMWWARRQSLRATERQARLWSIRSATCW